MRSSTFAASLLALLALYAPSATFALPSGSPASHHVVRSTQGQLLAPLLGAIQSGHLPIEVASGLTDGLPLAGLTSPRNGKKQKQQHQHEERTTQPKKYKASARSVPLPLRRPRETESQLGERDDTLVDESGCGEAGMHDCFVGHENERTKERRAELAGVGRLGARRMPSPAATLPVNAVATPAKRAAAAERGDRMLQVRKR